MSSYKGTVILINDLFTFDRISLQAAYVIPNITELNAGKFLKTEFQWTGKYFVFMQVSFFSKLVVIIVQCSFDRTEKNSAMNRFGLRKFYCI